MKIVTIENSQPVTTTLAISEGAKATHESVIKLARKYEGDLSEFGGVRFEIQPFETAGGIQHRQIAYLNESQSTLLLTYMRNSPIVRDFKKTLVREFWRLHEAEKTRRERQSARLEAPELTAALKNARELEGKDTQGHHYANEYNLINRLVLGMTAKQYIAEHGFAPSTAIRDTMRPIEIQAIAELQRANTSLIDMGIDYQERKAMLKSLLDRKFKQALIDEVMRIES